MKRPLNPDYHPPAPTVPVLLRAPGDAAVVRLVALIDTGADICVVPERYVEELDLPPVRATLAAGVFGAVQEVVIYRAELEIAEVGVFRVEAFASGESRAIVGRSVLRHLVLHVDGPRGTLTLDNPRRRGSAGEAARAVIAGVERSGAHPLLLPRFAAPIDVSRP